MIINLNCNNEVSNIISNKPGGVYRDFVLETNPVKKNELIVYASNFLSLKYKCDIFLESKKLSNLLILIGFLKNVLLFLMIQVIVCIRMDLKIK